MESQSWCRIDTINSALLRQCPLKVFGVLNVS